MVSSMSAATPVASATISTRTASGGSTCDPTFRASTLHHRRVAGRRGAPLFRAPRRRVGGRAGVAPPRPPLGRRSGADRGKPPPRRRDRKRVGWGKGGSVRLGIRGRWSINKKTPNVYNKLYE